MLTIFSVPKPFKKQISVIQQNAIRSWLKLGSDCQILLFGKDQGLAEISEKLGVKHIDNIMTTDYGTPLLDSIFEQAQRLADHNTICYVNTDIILLDDLLPTVKKIQFNRFLMVGQRWDINIEQPLDFESNKWIKNLRALIKENGSLHPPAGSDYFVFPRGSIGKLPPFAVGRPAWDNWVIYHARSLGVPVIDATKTVTPVHQNHDYGHVPSGTGSAWEGPEADRNRSLLVNPKHIFTLKDANWLLTPRGLQKPRPTLRRARRLIKTFRMLRSHSSANDHLDQDTLDP